MYRDIWKKFYHTICSFRMFGSNGSILHSLTGFKVGNMILTDDLIYDLTGIKEVHICFYEQDGVTLANCISLNHDAFLGLLAPRDEFDHVGFTVFPADFKEFKKTGSLMLCRKCSPEIGSEVALISYQAEHRNLSLKKALITSNFKTEKNHCYIQFDSTLKTSSGGGPLIDTESGRVLGIVTNKEQKREKQYHDLIRIIDNNLEILKSIEGKWKLHDVDPIQVLMVNQSQIKHLAKQLFVTSSTPTGFALEAGNIREYLDNIYEFDDDYD